jgi:hypothetical protein
MCNTMGWIFRTRSGCAKRFSALTPGFGRVFLNRQQSFAGECWLKRLSTYAAREPEHETDFKVGQRVQLHPATHRAMIGLVVRLEQVPCS